ncbi:hypothetical protein FOA43_004425 [Brettanomyces nanus]|uniref:BTB domain-containing protein n=1 Tax=Eeniella nana TaxID=13502 RepID=A0A875S7V2_EENNA|nr:uncharacterized protein FOA43_004425 [Brettanomyces nanus]QPG77028.1 hypothetical protein FOA43_004425 [Brettanomyces nanus]
MSHIVLVKLLLSSSSASQLIKAKDRDGFTPLDLLSSDGLAHFRWLPESIGRVHRYRKPNKHELAALQASPVKELNLEARFISRDTSSLPLNTHRPLLSFLPSRGGSDILFSSLSDSSAHLNPVDPSSLKLHYGDSHYYTRLSDRISYPRIKNAVMSKFHRIILTCEPRGNIFVSGLGSNGRLGIGSSHTKSGFVPVTRLHDERIVAADVSDDHTVCLSSSNNVYTWGSNTYGQLGYYVDTDVDGIGSHIDPSQPLPRSVCLGDLKKNSERLLGVTCSKYHTVVYTRHCLYIWGLNLGQFGFTTDPTATRNDRRSETRSETRSNSTSLLKMIENVPRKLEFKHGVIRQVSATERATLVLTEKDEIHAYLHGYHARILPPLLSKIDDSNFNAFRPRVLSQRKRIVKMVTQKASSVCLLLYDNGNVTQLTMDMQSKNTGDFTKSLRFSTVWKASKRHMRCTDVDMGNDGSVIICVADGSVYKRTKRIKVKQSNSSHGAISRRYKFNRVFDVNRVVRVITDPSFDKFFFIRDEVDLLPHRMAKSCVFRDISRLSPMYELDDRHLQIRLIVDTLSEPLLLKEDTYKADFLGKTFQSLCSNNNEIGSGYNDSSDDEEEVSLKGISDKIYRAYLSRWSTSPVIPVVRLSYFDTQGISDMLQSEDLEYWLTLKDLESGSKHYDFTVVVKDDFSEHQFEMRCHKELLVQRCPVLRKLICHGGDPLQLNGISAVCESPCSLYISGKVTVRAIGIFLHFLYTDQFLDVWNHFPLGKVPAEIQRSRVSFECVSRLFGIVSPVGRTQCVSSLLEDLEQLLAGDRGDTEIILRDGTLMAPSFLLSCRSAYFETILSETWTEVVPGQRTLHIPEASVIQFRAILRYFAGCDYLSLFEGLKVENAEEFCNFCLDLIDIANEFLLDELSDICQLCLKDFITLDNYEVLLVRAYQADARKLFENCLWFVYNNLGLLLFDSDSLVADVNSFDKSFWLCVDAGIKWFDSLKHTASIKEIYNRKEESSSPFVKSPNTLIMEFMSDIKSFDSHFVHPLLWDALGSFKEEDDLMDVAFSRRRSSSKAKEKEEEKEKPLYGIHHALVPGSMPSSASLDRQLDSRHGESFTSTDSFGSESAIADDFESVGGDDFVVISGGNNRRCRSSANRRSPDSGNGRPQLASVSISESSSVSRRQSSTGMGSMAMSASTSSTVSSLPSLDEALKSREKRSSYTPKYKYRPSSASSTARLSQKERKKKELSHEAKPESVTPVPTSIAPAPWTGSSTWKTATPVPVALQFPPTGSSVPAVASSGKQMSAWQERPKVAAKVSLTMPDTPVGSVTSFDSVLLEEKMNKEIQQSSMNQRVSLEDVQREEEFARWWEEESAKVQNEMRRGKENAKKAQKKNHRKVKNSGQYPRQGLHGEHNERAHQTT